MSKAEHVTSRAAAVLERPALLPSAALPTHITSHLPPIRSLNKHNRPDASRMPFRRRHNASSPLEPQPPPEYATRRLPNSHTLQTFLTVTEVPHCGHPQTPADNHDKNENGKDEKHHASHHGQSDASHGWRVRKTPIFSGLVAPFSIVLEIPGLTSKWYAKIDQNGIVERFIDNPTILTVGLAISLSAAVVANFAIICRFLEILRPRQSIALAIAGFMLHDTINLVALATFGGIYGPKHDGLSLSAAYWMVCAATITSTLVTISLVVDLVRTKDFRHAGSGLTQLQKGLVLSGMGLLLYLSLGSLIFVFVIQIDFITALYFSTATVLTVGFGDVVPYNAGGKVLVIFYAPIGIVLVALVVSSARSTILETFEATLLARTKERRRRLAQRRAALKEHKRKDRELRKIMPRAFTFGPGSSAANANSNDENDGSEFAEALKRMEHQAANQPTNPDQHADSGATAASHDSSATAASAPEPNGEDGSKKNGKADEIDEKAPIVTAGNPSLQRQISALQHQLLVEKQRSEEDFRQFEEHARHEAMMASRMKLVLAASVTAAFWLLGAVAFSYSERWSYGESMWFCFIAMITIGYGDYHPYTQLGRAIFVIWGLMGVAVLTILLAVVQDAFGGVLDRMLTNSTSRLFNRAETRAKKRRLKKIQQEEKEALKHVDVESSAVDQAIPGRRRNPQRKSESDVRRYKPHSEAAVLERKSMEACVEPSALSDLPMVTPISQDGESANPETSPQLTVPPFLVEQHTEPEDSILTTHIHLPLIAAARVEDTLVSTPQKLALAALQTFQHSVRVMELHESTISQAMTDVPALRHYYNSRQPPKQGDENQSNENKRLDPETALQTLQASIRQAANPEYEKVSKLVVANLEFECHLRVLLAEFQGLKDRVEGFKQTQMERKRTMSLSLSANTSAQYQQQEEGRGEDDGSAEDPTTLSKV